MFTKKNSQQLKATSWEGSLSNPSCIHMQRYIENGNVSHDSAQHDGHDCHEFTTARILIIQQVFNNDQRLLRCNRKA